MGVFSNITGIVSNILKLGKDGNGSIKNNSGVIEARNDGDTDYIQMRAKSLQSGFGLNDIPAAKDIKGIFPLIEFSFTGASVPSAGSNTSKFGFCHTAGGSYSAGDVVYDDGTTLTKVVAISGLLSTSVVTGTISLIANGVYAKEGGSFVLKGDGTSSSTGVERVVALSFAFGSSATIDSTTSIPEGSVITRVETAVTTAFNGTSPTVAVVINGSTPLTVMTTSENNLKIANQYETLEMKAVEAVNAGTVRLNYTASSSSAGAGKTYVFYSTPLS